MTFQEQLTIAKKIGDKWAAKAREDPNSISSRNLLDILKEYNNEISKNKKEEEIE